MLRKLWKWVAATFSVVAILLALAIGLFRLLLPLVPQYHERIEAFASEAAGTPVRIERITARWGFAGPELRFSNARLLSAADSEPLLSASEGRIVLDLKALFGAREFRAGRVLLDGLVLEVSRTADRRWLVGGRSPGDGDGGFPSRLALGLRDAQIVFRDDVSSAGPWVFDDVELDVNLRGRDLVIDSELRLPPGLGSEAEVSVQAHGDLADFETVDWQAYVRIDGVDLFGWAPLMPADRIVPASGRGDIVAWVSSLGSDIQQATLHSDLHDVEMASADQTVRQYELLRGRLEYDRIVGGWHASGRDLLVRSGDESWPVTAFDVESVSTAEAGSLTYADIDYVRLDDVAPFFDWLPDSVRDPVAALNPRGVARDVSFRMTRRGDKAESYSLRAGFERVGFSPYGRFPGFQSLAGQLRVDSNGGRVQLDPQPLVIDMPQVLGQPLVTRRTSGAVLWRRSPRGWLVVSDNVSIDHPHFDLATHFELKLDDSSARSAGEAASPVLNLQATFGQMQLDRLRTLMPRPLLPETVQDWLDTALVSGDVTSATLGFDGPLAQFPFDDGGGEFRAVVEVRDARIDYAKQWPPATEVDGTVVFNNASVSGGVTRAQLGGNRISSAEVAIPDLRKAVLELHTVADGLLENLHEFLVATPVVDVEDGVLSRLQLSGDGSAKVDISLPLNRKLGLPANVSVIVSTESGRAGLQGWDHRLDQLSGSLQFRNGKFSARDIGARLLGAPVAIDVSPGVLDTGEKTYPSTVATLRGQVSEQNLQRLDTRLTRYLSGSTPYTATVTIPDASAAIPVSIDVTSRLEGMAVTLPAPLEKAAPSSRNLVLNIALPEGGARTDAIYGDIANARMNWVQTAGGWRLERGGVHLGLAPAELPDGPGIAVTGVVSHIDIGAWLGIVTGDSGGGAAAGGGESGNGGAALRGLRIEAAELDAFGQRLRDARLTVDRSEREWLIQVDSDVAAGAVFVPFKLGQQPIIANMQLLHLGAGEEDGQGANSAAETETVPPDPREIPAMTVEADDFRIGDMRLGRLQATIGTDADGVVLREFTTENEAFSAAGSGLWEHRQTGQRTELAVTLTSSDVSATLERLGFEGIVDAAGASVEMTLSWPGPPGRRVREEVSGDVSVSVGPGQIDTVNPGAGRALGLFSFTALPRRLSLDFRDVFDKGFGFDYIEGDFRLENGNAYTSNLVLEGPAAQVGIVGRTGLATRDYDQTAVVYGNFGAALPVAGAIAGGPIGGAAMLIFSELFKRPLQNMARINYRITGSWDEPDIVRVLPDSDEEGAS